MRDELEPAVAASAAYLRSPEARASLARDPYWPKWSSPWWHALALAEAGRLDAVPPELARALLARVREHYLPCFPHGGAPLPPGKDFWLHVICHCALASLLRLLLSLGLDGEEGLPWARGWFARYQLPDGGLNCDEQACARAAPKSSIASTAPVLEYLLDLAERRPLAPDEAAVLDGGAAYLLSHQLVCSATTGRLLRPEWLVPSRPRFYEYDALRGLSAVVRWAERRRRPLPARAVALARAELARRLGPGGAPEVRRWHAGQQTRLSPAPGEDGWGPTTRFPLLEALSGTAAERARVEAEWRAAEAGLARLSAAGLLP